MEPRRSAVVVIPTFNERESIPLVLDRVLAAAAVDVLVVDDGSPDGTADVVAGHPAFGTRVHLLERTSKDGLGGAYRAGFAWALAQGYARIVQMDADLSHPPEKVPALLAAIDGADGADAHDIAVGSRYVRGGGVRHWTLLRRLISWAGNRYVRLVLGLPVRDATAGFKAFTAVALARTGALNSHSNGYCFQIETVWRATRRGLSIVEVPITFTDRVHGTSKMSSGIVLEAMLRVLRWRATELRHGAAVRPRTAA